MILGAFRVIVFTLKVAVTKKNRFDLFQNNFDFRWLNRQFFSRISEEANFHLKHCKHNSVLPALQFRKRVNKSWKQYLNLSSKKMAYSEAKSCMKLYFTLFQEIITKVFTGQLALWNILQKYQMLDILKIFW